MLLSLTKGFKGNSNYVCFRTLKFTLSGSVNRVKSWFEVFFLYIVKTVTDYEDEPFKKTVRRASSSIDSFLVVSKSFSFCLAFSIFES